MGGLNITICVLGHTCYTVPPGNHYAYEYSTLLVYSMK